MEVRTLLLVTALGGALFHKQYAPASTAAPAFVGPLFPGTAIPARSSRWANIGSRVNDSRGIARLVGAIGGTAKDDCAHRWGHRFARVGTAAAGGTNPDVNGSLLMPSLTVADSNCHSCPPPPVGTAFTAVARCRGGGGAAGREGASAVADGAASDTATGDAAATVEVLSGEMQKNRLLLDHVEDVMGDIGRLLTVVGTPAFHFFRFGFGLCLIFYGMAFRTFAFHVIVFRISGFKQVHIALGKLSIKYRSARQSIREAAAAAKSAKRAREQLEHHNKLKAARRRMVEEKKQLLANGRKLTKEDTVKFMEMHDKELRTIKEEQAIYNSINSSMISVQRSVDPNNIKSSLSALYGALVTSFTASTYQTAGQIILGLHIGTLLKTHLLDLFGPALDPIGYRLDLITYYDEAEIPYMGNANAMDATHNLILNIFCYTLVFAVIRVYPRVALKTAMVYYGARIVTDYIIAAVEPVRRKLGLMTANHTPGSAIIHAGLTVLGFCYHRNTLHTASIAGFHPLVMGPGAVGLVEPLVRLAVWVSEVLHRIDFFTVSHVTLRGK